jgi:hypothetical protein
MTITITLTSAGSDSGPFDLYTNATGSFTLMESGVSKITLLSGYTVTTLDGTTVVRVQSTGECTNYQDIPVGLTTTTTTTTVAPAVCTEYTVSTSSATGQSYTYTACDGTLSGGNIGGSGGYDADTFCAQTGTVVLTGAELTLTTNLACTVEPTTTVAPTTTQPPIGLCTYYEAVVDANDLAASQDGNVYFVYQDCDGVTQTSVQSNAGTFLNAFCSTGFSGTYIIVNNIQNTGLSTANYTAQACGNV